MKQPLILLAACAAIASAHGQAVIGGNYSVIQTAPGLQVFEDPVLVVNFDAPGVVAWRSFFAGTPVATSGGTVKAGTLGVIGDATYWFNGFQSEINNVVVFDWTDGGPGVVGWDTNFETATNNSANGSGWSGSAGYPLEYLVTPGAVGTYEFKQYGYYATSGGETVPGVGTTKMELYDASNTLLSSLTVDVTNPEFLGWTTWGSSNFQFTITDPGQYLKVSYEVANATNAYKGLFGASLAVVPEPGTVGMLLGSAAVMAVGWVSRRSRGKA